MLPHTTVKLNIQTVEIGVPELEDWDKVLRLRKNLKASEGKPLVLFFYPKDDTPGCTTENKDFSALAGDFAKAGAALLGVSKDPPTKHGKFIAKHGLTAPLASDPETDGLAATRERSPPTPRWRS